MCLLFLARDAHPSHRLIVAANRDEFFARPSARVAGWSDHPQVIAGRDREHGGTWMGVTRRGRFAALTNYREPGQRIEGAPSRGLLVSEFLVGEATPAAYAGELARRADEYNGFNLVLGDGDELLWFSNRGDGPQRLAPGVHGLSNHLLGTPWPKVAGGLREFEAGIGLDGDELIEALLAVLADRSIPPDADLPHTGVDLEWERILGARLIVSPDYGTRCSSVALLDRGGGGRFVEQTLDRGEPVGRPVDISW
jgi:uncharacterized protein with NRDE domain